MEDEVRTFFFQKR